MSKQYINAVRSLSGFVWILVVALILTGGALTSHASKLSLQNVKSETPEKPPMVTLTRGMADIINLPGDVADVMVADPSLVDVMALQSDRLYVVGMNYGSTNIMAIDAQGNVIEKIMVHVKIDETAGQQLLESLFPDEDFKVVSAVDQVILTGHVSNPEVANQIANVLAHYIGDLTGEEGTVDELIANMLTIEGEQQVTLQVRIVEASRNILREIGIDTDFSNFTSGELSAVVGTVATGLTSTPVGRGIFGYDSGTLGPISMVVDALEENGLANTLAEPNLTAISGQQAGFLAGGEVPIPTGIDDNGNITITYRPFGVALNFRPVVMTDDRISLQLQTEVSSISSVQSFNLGTVQVPNFTVRRAETTVEVASGNSLMIAGLLQSEATKDFSQLPGIGNIPIIGDLMSSDSFQRSETELIIIVTPLLVKPFKEPMAKYEDNEMPHGLLDKIVDPLAFAFEDNIRRTYAKMELEPELFGEDGEFGYIID